MMNGREKRVFDRINRIYRMVIASDLNEKGAWRSHQDEEDEAAKVTSASHGQVVSTKRDCHVGFSLLASSQ